MKAILELNTAKYSIYEKLNSFTIHREPYCYPGCTEILGGQPSFLETIQACIFDDDMYREPLGR